MVSDAWVLKRVPGNLFQGYMLPRYRQHVAGNNMLPWCKRGFMAKANFETRVPDGSKLAYRATCTTFLSVSVIIKDLRLEDKGKDNDFNCNSTLILEDKDFLPGQQHSVIHNWKVKKYCFCNERNVTSLDGTKTKVNTLQAWHYNESALQLISWHWWLTFSRTFANDSWRDS